MKEKMRCKHFLGTLIIFLFPIITFSQQPKLLVEQSGKQLFIRHKVVPKENFYSVGRMFNVAPRDLANYNKLTMKNGLKIGQLVNIPLDQENFTQVISRSAAEVLVPLYHKVRGGETLFRIGTNYKDVPLRRLKEWNNLSGDQVNKDAMLIVGFLKVNKTESPLAVNAVGPAFQSTTEDVAVEEKTPAKPATATPTRQPQATRPVNTTAETTTSIVTEKPVPVVEVQRQTEPGEGFFRQEFGPYTGGGQEKSVSGTASVFKSTSGWQDGKYYCFNNEATPGSVIRIGVPGSSKFIFAKVLDAIPDIKQNEGLSLVLSNAGAESLGITSDKFEAVIQYFE